MPKLRDPKDFVAGLLFVAIGLSAIILSGDYRRGTAATMGPGYFPLVLGAMLTVLGLALVLRALRIQGSPIPAWKWRPTLIVLGSVVLFGIIVTRAGLVASTILLIVLSSTASHEFRWKESLVSSFILAAAVVGVFVLGLKLQLPIWPGSN